MFEKLKLFLDDNKAVLLKLGGIAGALTVLYYYLEKPRLKRVKEEKLREVSKRIYKKIYPVFQKMALVCRRMVLPKVKAGASEQEIEKMLLRCYNFRASLWEMRVEELEKEGLELFDMQEWLFNYDKSDSDINEVLDNEVMLKRQTLKGKAPVVFCLEIKDFLDQELVLEITKSCLKELLNVHIQSRIEYLHDKVNNVQSEYRGFYLLMKEVEIYKDSVTSLEQFKDWLRRPDIIHHPLCYFESAKHNFLENSPDFKTSIKTINDFQRSSIQSIYKAIDMETLINLKKSININKICN